LSKNARWVSKKASDLNLKASDSHLIDSSPAQKDSGFNLNENTKRSWWIIYLALNTSLFSFLAELEEGKTLYLIPAILKTVSSQPVLSSI